MLFQFPRDVRVGGALQHLAVNGIGDDGLIFPGQIIVEQPGHFGAGNDGVFLRVVFFHNASKMFQGTRLLVPLKAFSGLRVRR